MKKKKDEAYYITAATDDATVFCGLAKDDPDALRKALENHTKTKMEHPEEFVQQHKSQTGDFFLIPNGTVHSAGAGNLVLEISATPYIFTFKLHDWGRLDLDGQPRVLIYLFFFPKKRL